MQKYDVNVIGITLSRNQSEYSRANGCADPVVSATVEVRLQGWEEFDEPVDRIVTIGAFEAFKKERYAAFFDMAYRHPARRRPHAVAHDPGAHPEVLSRQWHPVTISDLKFMRFIGKEIFPGGSCRRTRTLSSTPRPRDSR